MAQDATEGRSALVAALERVARGERAALAELYRRTSAKLFGLCLRILSDRAEAEDVLQEVYLTVWNKAAQFDVARGVSPVTWLMIIARNRALDRLRARGQRFGALEEAEEIADLAPLADVALDARDASQRLAACLEALEARAASAIRAAFFGGQTYERLAAQAGMPLGSMKSLIRRSLMRLKACLEP
ncbi:MAG: sigma-70 family RNA polymerase sigma factor [Acidocella sp.]|nr:sigma-70 family RNA polymerase sigma factor [Acidocella sp.]